MTLDPRKNFFVAKPGVVTALIGRKETFASLDFLKDRPRQGHVTQKNTCHKRRALSCALQAIPPR